MPGFRRRGEDLDDANPREGGGRVGVGDLFHNGVEVLLLWLKDALGLQSEEGCYCLPKRGCGNTVQVVTTGSGTGDEPMVPRRRGELAVRGRGDRCNLMTE
jgi:hypothetical protein